MTSEQLKDLAERAAWTFVQTFLGTLATAMLVLPTISCAEPLQTVQVWLWTAFASALAAGVSALKTFVNATK